MRPLKTDEEFLFADEEDPTETGSKSGWKVLIVDDEDAIHSITKMVLGDFEFAGRPLSFLEAYSGEEAKQVLRETPDIALVLLDVVMENDEAGLDVAKFIREELKNKDVRIVLRTGQPGQAPEHRVIADYDINDYKEKTDLTAQKLTTLMYSTLRSYRDILALNKNKEGLERVIDASATIFEAASMERFAQGVLDQLTSLLHLDEDAVYIRGDGVAARREEDNIQIVAGSGAYADKAGAHADEVLGQDVLQTLAMRQVGGENRWESDSYFGRFRSNLGTENYLFMNGVRNLSDVDKRLVEVFSRNVGIAFENIELHGILEKTQREIAYRLGEAVELRSKETGNHVKRVAEYSALLADAAGLDADKVDLLKSASPLHDVGKISVPDAILNKPGKLDAEEWRVVQEHAVAGYELLKGSNCPIIDASAEISLAHHEKWDGSGYPNGRSGEDIPIFGRITAVADVFDALGSDRSYKTAWPLEKILNLFREERGRHFDPNLVDLLLGNLEKVVAIRDAYAEV